MQYPFLILETFLKIAILKYIKSLKFLFFYRVKRWSSSGDLFLLIVFFTFEFCINTFYPRIKDAIARLDIYLSLSFSSLTKDTKIEITSGRDNGYKLCKRRIYSTRKLRESCEFVRIYRSEIRKTALGSRGANEPTRRNELGTNELEQMKERVVHEPCLSMRPDWRF